MSSARLWVYAAVVVAVGIVTWIATAPGTTAEPAKASSTAAPASTLPAGSSRQPLAPAVGTANTTSATPSATTPASVPSTTTGASTTASSSTTTPSSTSTVQHGDEGDYDGTEPESIAVDFVISAFAECWSCDADARQRHLSKIAVPQVVAEWPPMSIEERSVFTVRTVTIDNVVVKDETTIEVTAAVTTETDIDPAKTRTITLEVSVDGGVVNNVTLPSAEVAGPETTSR